MREKIWDLISKKLAGEASKEELNELDKELQRDPALRQQLAMLESLWQKQAKQDEQQRSIAWKKHSRRMVEFYRKMAQDKNEPIEERITGTKKIL